jgi:putative ABC transport system substrate-binding protein
MRRRDFIASISKAVAWTVAPGAACAEPPLPVIGWLDYRSSSPSVFDAVAFFRQGLAETGFVEGRNVVIEYRFAEFRADNLPSLAAEFVSRKVAVIATAGGEPVVVAAKAATTTIPVVFALSSDPVDRGFIASLARPGGNLTGTATLSDALFAKRLEYMHELMPAATTVAFLVSDLANPYSQQQMKAIQSAADSLGLRLVVFTARSDNDIDAVFAAIRQRADALVVGADGGFFQSRRDRVAALALSNRIASIYQFRNQVVAGGLMSYGTSLAEAFRIQGIYAGRILSGEKPADLPVQQSTKVELVINMKTAKALGLTVPLTLLVRADEVIE